MTGYSGVPPRFSAGLMDLFPNYQEYQLLKSHNCSYGYILPWELAHNVVHHWELPPVTGNGLPKVKPPNKVQPVANDWLILGYKFQPPFSIWFNSEPAWAPELPVGIWLRHRLELCCGPASLSAHSCLPSPRSTSIQLSACSYLQLCPGVSSCVRKPNQVVTGVYQVIEHAWTCSSCKIWGTFLNLSGSPFLQI